MYYVYLLRSETVQHKTYIGITDCISRRIKQHNAPGRQRHTTKYQPWVLIGYIALCSKERATKLEQYLKSGSGWEFARRHLW